jgi:hypothetical protein
MSGYVAGLTLAKLNGIYRVDVMNSSWSAARALNQFITGGGVRKSKGTPLVSGSFDEIIEVEGQGPFNWFDLEDFSIQIYDQPTRSVLIFEAIGCDWERLDGNSAAQGANTSKKIGWKGTRVPKV